MRTATIIITILFALAGIGARGEGFSQTIRGQVIDKQTKISLPGANVFIAASDPLIGTSTDMNGYFALSDVPVGRIDIRVSYLGYVPVTIPNINLTTGKEIVLTIELEEEVYIANEVVIVASEDKKKPINEMAMVSARTFSIEESQRYAGARNDVARMASNFAGVGSANDAVNDIVIRGNSPNGLLWRLEGVDIPNPNHFGQMGATGGPVSMLNNNVLKTSDFMTGAFPAGYGNALSGVFDLHMRKGNYEKYEFLGQIGFNGFEFGIEGPVSRNNNSSFLVNYRYSTLALMSSMGFNFGTGSAIPYYQDLNLKMDLPTKRAGTFSIFGMGGSNKIDFINSENDINNEDLYSSEDTDIYSRGRMGVLGISNTLIINPSTYIRSTLAGTYLQNKGALDSLTYDARQPVPFIRRDLQTNNLIAKIILNKKFNPKNNLKAGGMVNRIGYDMLDSMYYSTEGEFRIVRDERDNTWYADVHAEWMHKFTDIVVLNLGIHYKYLFLNGSQALEPRLGFRWTVRPAHTLSLGYGMHSHTQMPQVYFIRFRQDDGSFYKPNENLDFTRAHHFVLSYDYNISETMRVKAETYYQKLNDAPVEVTSSSFSMLNFSSMQWDVPDSLVNGGPGRNFGVELTLEKFMDKGFYFLVTTSLFDSKYKGSDGVERSTAFDSKYVVNVLGGNEFEISGKNPAAKARKWITADIKMTAAGGQKYTPLDLEQSQKEGITVYQDDNAYSEQFRDYFRLDVRVAFRLDFKGISQEFAFDVQNVTNRQNPLYMKYNRYTQNEQIVYQIGVIPMMQYKILF